MLLTPIMAFLPGSSTGEWIVIGVVVLIVVGPKRLPEIARKIGRTMEMFRRAADEFKSQVMNMDQDATPAAPTVAADGSSDSMYDPYLADTERANDEMQSGQYGDPVQNSPATLDTVTEPADLDGVAHAAKDIPEKTAEAGS